MQGTKDEGEICCTNETEGNFFPVLQKLKALHAEIDQNSSRTLSKQNVMLSVYSLTRNDELNSNSFFFHVILIFGIEKLLEGL